MIETAITLICSHAHEAHWIIFICLLLAGFNIPLSEDVLVILAGALVSSCVPEHFYLMYAWIFAGCLISGWEAYWLGRALGAKLYEIRWFNRFLNPTRINRIENYFQQYGMMTFIAGRFIPGGVRNGLFMTSGFIKMPFGIFMLRDGIGCLASTLFLYFVGLKFGENYSLIFKYFKTFEHSLIALLILFASSSLIFLVIKKRKPFKI